MQDYQRIKELEQNLSNLVIFGKLDQIDAAKHKARVKVGELLTNWLDLPRIGGAKFSVYYLPPQGAGVLVLCPMGRLEEGYIINYYNIPEQCEAGEAELRVEFADGAFFHYKEGEFNLEAKTIKIKSDKLEVDAKTHIKQGLEVSKDIKTNGSVKAKGDVAAGLLEIKLTTHKHAHPQGFTTAVLP